MTPRVLDRTITPTEEEVRQARAGRTTLNRMRRNGRCALQLIARGEGEERIPVPESLLRLLSDALDTIAAGRGVAVAALDEEMTTQEAADLLNVSRPFLIDLLDKGEIPFRMVGTHRRLRVSDVVDYKRRRDEDAERAFEELVKEGQRIRLDYD